MKIIIFYVLYMMNHVPQNKTFNIKKYQNKNDFVNKILLWILNFFFKYFIFSIFYNYVIYRNRRILVIKITFWINIFKLKYFIKFF